jgi:DNA uptake protein ComE-like DNA-binding protein
MRFSNPRTAVVFLSLAAFGVFVSGCNARSSDSDLRAQEEKVEQEVAKATEKAKPAIQQAGKELREGAKVAAEEAKAAAKGAKEGWEHGTRSKVDLNSASESDLISLPGITHHDARRIISRRPYRDSHEVVTKGALTEVSYARIRDGVTAI